MRLRAVSVLAVLIAVSWAAYSQAHTTSSQSSASAGSRPTALAHHLTVRLPPGWRLVQAPINNVIDPFQVLAAASFPAKPGKPRSCYPHAVLADKPASGAVVQVVEWAKGPPGPRVGRFPPRPRPFRLPRRDYGNYECSGPSYNIAFRDHHHAFQAFVWLNPRRVAPEIRRQVIQLLSSMRFDAPNDH